MNNNWFCENIRATNPCGEQPLPPHGSCLLGSVNLTRFVENPFTPEARFNFEKYRKVVRIFTRMLDNVEHTRSEEHTSELQSRPHLVCRLLLENKNNCQC